MNEQDLLSKAEEYVNGNFGYEEYSDRCENAFISGVKFAVEFASEVSAEQLDNIVETLYSHYKNNGGYTRTAASFIQKITGKKWERDDELKEAYKRIAELEKLVFEYSVGRIDFHKNNRQ